MLSLMDINPYRFFFKQKFGNYTSVTLKSGLSRRESGARLNVRGDPAGQADLDHSFKTNYSVQFHLHPERVSDLGKGPGSP